CFLPAVGRKLFPMAFSCHYSRLCSLVAMLGFFFLATRPAPAGRPDDWSIRGWQTEHGLPQNSVTALIQTRDGYLWVGTFNGLARCDAGQWTAVPLPAGWPGGKIRDIAADATGALWLLHQTGLLLRLSDGHVIPAARTGSYDAEASLVRDAAGACWFLRDHRL